MVSAAGQPQGGATLLPWVAFACAVVVLTALPFLLTPDNDPAIWLIPLPALLLALGGLRSGGNRLYAIACLALGITMDSVLLAFMFFGVIGPLGGLMVATAPTALLAGGVPIVQAIRGRLSSLFGVLGGAVSIIAVLAGAFILWQLARYASP